MNSIRVPVVEKILSANDQLATQNRSVIEKQTVFFPSISWLLLAPEKQVSFFKP